MLSRPCPRRHETPTSPSRPEERGRSTQIINCELSSHGRRGSKESPGDFKEDARVHDAANDWKPFYCHPIGKIPGARCTNDGGRNNPVSSSWRDEGEREGEQ